MSMDVFFLFYFFYGIVPKEFLWGHALDRILMGDGILINSRYEQIVADKNGYND